MTKVEKIEDLKKGTIINNKNLTELFKCSPRGGMRRSLRTNSLVLLSYKNRKPYKDISKKNGLWQYTAMGRNGNQKLDFMSNKTVLNSNETGVKLYLFSVENDKYEFIDRVLLAGEPKQEKQEGEDGKERDVWIFQLIEVGKEANIFEFLLSCSRDKLEKTDNILSFPRYELSLHSVDPLSNLMRMQGIDTLTSPGGWFFTSSKFFNNSNTKSKYKNGYINEIIEKDSKVSKGIVFEGQNKFINPFYGTRKYRTPIKREKTTKFSEEFGFLMHKVEYKYPKSGWVKVEFIPKEISDNVNRNTPFVSLIIGPNGTGKSTVLSNLQKIYLDAFNYASSRGTEYISRDVEYKIVYQMGTDFYEICYEKNVNDENRNENPIYSKEYYKNEKKVSFYEVNLPKKVLASAFSINDRFTFEQNNEDSNKRYSYLGIKSGNNIARVGETTRNLVLNILQSSQKDYFDRNLKYITDFINVEPTFRIKYVLKKGKLNDLIDNNNIIKLQNRLRVQSKKEKEQISFIDDKDITDFLSKLLENQYESEIFRFDSNFISIDFNFRQEGIYHEYYDELYILWHLYELGILNEPIVFLKKGEFYKLEDASSGEAQYITTLINILSNVEKDSLVIIDEPETSLHPNWQYKYVNGIREIFKNYNSCHFIMATHSHFLISDLAPETSSIVSFRRINDSELITELHDDKTFGWSPDDILYNIFHMKTARNYYLEEDLTKLLSFISSGEEDKKEEIELILHKLSKLTLKPNDPLNHIIENARRYLTNA
ncbi:TPA: AAA family ATPase [Bacillus cereus]